MLWTFDIGPTIPFYLSQICLSELAFFFIETPLYAYHRWFKMCCPIQYGGQLIMAAKSLVRVQVRYFKSKFQIFSTFCSKDISFGIDQIQVKFGPGGSLVEKTKFKLNWLRLLNVFNQKLSLQKTF